MKNLHGKKLAVVIVVILVVLAVAGFVFYNNGISEVSSDDTKDVIVTVEPGSSAYGVLEALDEAGLVNNKLCAKVYMKVSGPDNLQAYTYILNKSMDLPEILDIISKGDLKHVLMSKVTIIEGGKATEATKSIAKAVKCKPDEVIAKWSDKNYLKSLIDKYWFLTDDILNEDLKCPLEGYLYPDTYFISDKNPSVEDVTEQILNNTDKNLSEIKDEIESSSKTVHQILTLSSIVENESYFEKDKAVIAGVFMNRLEQDMPLQSDSTVLYAMGKTKINVSTSELQVDSPYNTYKYKGIPVGPVCNPSLDTIKATINYDENDYLYFFATKDGKVLYAKTYDEHLKNVKENKWY